MARTHRRGRKMHVRSGRRERRRRDKTRRLRRKPRRSRSRSRRGGATTEANGWKNNQSNEGPCLVVYHMNGCGACEHFKAAWNSYVSKHKNQCAIAVERHDNPSKYGMDLVEHQRRVSAFPTIMLIGRNGEVLDTKIGAVDEGTLDDFVKSSRRN